MGKDPMENQGRLTNFKSAAEQFSNDAKYVSPVVATQQLWKTFRILRA